MQPSTDFVVVISINGIPDHFSVLRRPTTKGELANMVKNLQSFREDYAGIAKDGHYVRCTVHEGYVQTGAWFQMGAPLLLWDVGKANVEWITPAKAATAKATTAAPKTTAKRTTANKPGAMPDDGVAMVDKAKAKTVKQAPTERKPRTVPTANKPKAQSKPTASKTTAKTRRKS